MRNIIEVLEERGFIEALTSEELRTLSNKPLKVYCGFDPSSDSLHVGNMVAIMGLAWFQRCGHIPVALVGGATGMIGDPSGKTSERQLLDAATIEKNLVGISENLARILGDEKAPVKHMIVNNYDWFKEIAFIDFLRDVGKFFRVGVMLAKDSVRSRMESEDGMSFTEFCYQTLQGYDFYHLNKEHGVNVQLGGSDQWGNITAGIELTRKKSGQSTYGITFPLLTRSDGQKFGKSEKGAIWLSPKKLSPYEFYQYIVRVTDEDVIKLMRLLTFMEMTEIRQFEAMMKESEYVPNTAQKKLAAEVTLIVHGEAGLDIALKVTQAALPGAKTILNAEVLETFAKDMPSCILPINEVVDVALVDLIVKVGLQSSRTEAKKLIRNGGASMNNDRIEKETDCVKKEDLIEGRLLLLSVGKKNKLLIKTTGG
ncbi:MAG: tyrosine--tRNA ligase [Parachlamydiaceae bacterium]|nr:tyrosine--tRNA ligase [Parachlamydiaceae bacterium]